MKILLKNARVVNEGRIISSDVFIDGERFAKIAPRIDLQGNVKEIDAKGYFLMPGIIDDQVHFREPGLTHKADLYTESRAAVAGGVTSFMDMPNVNPPSLSQELLEQRYQIASQKSLANYSFYMGVSNDNAEEVLKTNPADVCGIKIFMGSSTGNMLVDDESTLALLFRNAPMLIATHCEDETTVLENLELFREKYGNNIPVACHPLIRNEEACYKSSSYAIGLAKKYNTRLHILHISTSEELSLFRNDIPLSEKRVTAEVCVHHLFFNAGDYARLGSKIKWNPAVKDLRHAPLLFDALLDNRLDVIATDHAPHTLEEKGNHYVKCPGGAPMIQHSLQVMLQFYHAGRISLEQIAAKMSHDVATCFQIHERGAIREGYFADCFLLDPDAEVTVTKENILYKCGWSPLEGMRLKGKVLHTIVSGHHAYDQGVFNNNEMGKRLGFNR